MVVQNLWEWPTTTPTWGPNHKREPTTDTGWPGARGRAAQRPRLEPNKAGYNFSFKNKARFQFTKQFHNNPWHITITLWCKQVDFLILQSNQLTLKVMNSTVLKEIYLIIVIKFLKSHINLMSWIEYCTSFSFWPLAPDVLSDEASQAGLWAWVCSLKGAP